ncbi:MAG: hypothetical protein WBC91_18870 [Phototrophicaceae bacterium]
MASEQEIQITAEASNETPLAILAMIGGLGIITMVVAAGVGVVWENADSALIGLFLMAGFGFIVASVGGWVIVERPHENFDDINQGIYHGHHHDDDHSDHVDEPGEVNVDEPVKH